MLKYTTNLVRTTGSLASIASKRTVYNSALTSDINITKTGKTLLSVGSGGRSSRTGYTATVFGASGFIGRYLTSKLARHGTITVIPFRDEMKKRFLKVSGDLGVVNFLEFDIRNLESIDEACRHSDIVFNLMGTEVDSKNFTYNDVNIEGARRVAQAAKDNGVPRLVHVSSYNADINSTSEFYSSKGYGELVVKDIFPDATIVRPGPVYGREDHLLNEIAPPRLFSCNNDQASIYPVHVMDIARALEIIGYNDATAGQTFELSGPEKYTIRELANYVCNVSLREYSVMDVPKPVMKAAALLLNKIVYWRTITPDLVERQFIDQVIDPSAKTFTDLGMTSAKFDEWIFHYCKYLRPQYNLHDLPPTEQELKELKAQALS